MTLSQLKKAEIGLITDVNTDEVPLKLLEMGCLPGNLVTLVQVAPFGCPLYFIINDSHVAIRLETAKQIEITLQKSAVNVK
jgi:ferrous iron transport protein A